MTLSSDPNEVDIIDIQDKLGYVDTGPVQQRQARNMTRNQLPSTVATSSTSHIIIKEPIPQRQVQFPMETQKKRSSTSARPEIIQDSFHGTTQPMNAMKKSNSTDAASASIPYSLNVTQQSLQQHQRPFISSRSNSFNNKGKEKYSMAATEMPSLALPTSSSSSSSADVPSKYTSNGLGLRGPPQTTQERDEIKDLFVSKFLELKELAEMLQLIDEPTSQPAAYAQKRSFEQPPKPTPSKSDPNSYPQLRRQPSKGRVNGYAYPSPEVNRKVYNKSADMTTNHQEPNNRHSTTNRAIYNTRDYLADHHDNRTPHDVNAYYNHHHPSPQQPAYYHVLYGDNPDYYEEPFFDPEDYYMAQLHGPPPPPPLPAQRMQQRYYDGRPRRKSFSNLHEEQQYKLNRKGSRSNLRRPPARQQQAQFYDYSDVPPPSLHHPHHHQYAYGGPPYYQNQQYSPNGGG